MSPSRPRRPTGSQAIETPCVQICVLDPVSGLCVGCGRTGEEIGGWSAMTPEARARIMAALPERMRALGSAPVPPRR